MTADGVVEAPNKEPDEKDVGKWPSNDVEVVVKDNGDVCSKELAVGVDGSGGFTVDGAVCAGIGIPKIDLVAESPILNIEMESAVVTGATVVLISGFVTSTGNGGFSGTSAEDAYIIHVFKVVGTAKIDDFDDSDDTLLNIEGLATGCIVKAPPKREVVPENDDLLVTVLEIDED